MMVAFISAPFRAANAWEIERNVRRAETVALKYWREGHAVFCPHANTRFFQGAADDAVWLNGDLEILARCDFIVMVDGWQQSEGCQAEYALAKERGLGIRYEETP